MAQTSSPAASESTLAATRAPLLDRRAIRAALAGGLIGGAFDLSYACIMVFSLRGIGPQRVFQSVASGWLGKAAFDGGWPTALLGFVSHFFIVCVAALIYVIVSRRIAVLARRPIVCGALYGAGIYFAMNYVIVPLSQATIRHTFNLLMVAELLVHMFLVGATIALFARRAS